MKGYRNVKKGIYYKEGSYTIVYYAGKKRYQEKAGKSIKQAERVLAKRIGEVVDNRFFPRERKCEMTFRELCRRYMEIQKDKKSYRKAIVYNVRKLLRHFGNIPIVDFDFQMIIQWRNSRKGQVKPATVNRELSTLKHMFTVAAKIDPNFRMNPAKDVRKLPEENERMRTASPEEFTKMIFHARQGPWYLAPIIITAFNTGMRLGEILRIKRSDVNWEQGTVHIPSSKSGKGRTVPLNDTVLNLWKKIPPHVKSRQLFYDSEGRKLGSIKRSFYSMLRKSGIEDFRFHDLRHTFATNFLASGGSIEALQKILGHGDIRMTSRYIHSTDRYLKESVRRMQEYLKNSGSRNIVDFKK